MNGIQLELSLEELVNGNHERCGNPRCWKTFPHIEGKFQRVKGLDERYYCNAQCASRQYLAHS